MNNHERIGELAKKWNNFLRRRLWPSSTSPKYRYCRAKLILNIIIGFTEVFRYITLSFIINDEDLTLPRSFGGILRPFGRVSRLFCSANGLLCLHSVLFRISLLRNYSNNLLTILAPYEEGGQIPLKGQYKERFKVYLKGC